MSNTEVILTDETGVLVSMSEMQELDEVRKMNIEDKSFRRLTRTLQINQKYSDAPVLTENQVLPMLLVEKLIEDYESRSSVRISIEKLTEQMNELHKKEEIFSRNIEIYMENLNKLTTRKELEDLANAYNKE